MPIPNETLKELAAIMDVNLLELLHLCDDQPLILSGILMARLACLNDTIGTGKDFRKLAEFVASNQSVSVHKDEPITDFSNAEALLKKFQLKGDE
jgi:hypothetical protein